MTFHDPTTVVELTAAELLLLRQRLVPNPDNPMPGIGQPAINSELDAKLCRAQFVLDLFDGTGE